MVSKVDRFELLIVAMHPVPVTDMFFLLSRSGCRPCGVVAGKARTIVPQRG